MVQSYHDSYNPEDPHTDFSCYVYCRYDANAKGHSHWLYRETITLDSNPNPKVKECLSLPSINFQWETVASNLEEFSEVAVRSS